jgi:hypothetical protein
VGAAWSSRGGMIDCTCCVGTCGVDDLPCSRLLNRPRCFSSTGAGACPFPPWKGVFLVALLAFFSLSSIFFLNVFASFSSANDKPARQSPSSKEWKKVRSWL